MTNKTIQISTKKQTLLDKIENLFYSKTFANVSMQEIATELNIKKASLYYHFPSKEALITETINHSFTKYETFIQDTLKKDLKTLIQKLIRYPSKSKNLFSIINQNWYCDNWDQKTEIRKKQERIFELLSTRFKEEYNFSLEKSFILISLLDDLWKKRCLFWKCPVSVENLVEEIYKMFEK